MSRITRILSLILTIAVCAASLLAAVPQHITYQGRISETGTPVTGNRQITFKLYNTAGTEVWSSGALTVPCTNGLFSMQLGAVGQPTLPGAIFSDTGTTVGLTVGAGPELNPRTRLSSVAFSYHALVADTATLAKTIADNSVTSSKINNGTIQLIDIAPNGAVTGQVIKWNGTAWTVANDSVSAAGPGGDITTVVAGTRLSGGGTSGDVTLNVDTAGLTTYYSRTIHIHALVDSATASARATTSRLADSAKTVRANALDSANIKDGSVTTADIKNSTLLLADLAQNGAASNQVIKFNGTSWIVANDSVGAVGSYLPLSGGTMTGPITSSGNPAITMGKGNFGNGNVNSGNWAFTTGQNNNAAGNVSTVAGIFDTAFGDLSAVLSGRFNRAGLTSTDIFSVVAGGDSNLATNSSFIGSGVRNSANFGSSVVGGRYNQATSQSFVGGGLYDTASGWEAFIGAGSVNRAWGEEASVVGGVHNEAGGKMSFVGGGWNDSAGAEYSAVVGGVGNKAGGSESFIGGGAVNVVSASNSSIVGGLSNQITGWASIIGGGVGDTVKSAYSGILTGRYNTAGTTIYDTGAAVVGGLSNRATASLSFVGGGSDNSATGIGSVVSGGNTNLADAAYSMVGGGSGNYASGWGSVIGGGEQNRATNDESTVAGGHRDTVTGRWGTIGGGAYNNVSSEAGVVAGGYGNRVSGWRASVGGGEFNNASGTCSMILGGSYNQASGEWALATGRRAKATHLGSFILADATDADIYSYGNNTFTIRAVGGMRFYTNAGLSSGVQIGAGSGSWSSLSDRSVKHGFRPVDGQQLLERIAAMNIPTWIYNSQPDSIRHIGPMAQDFYAAFGVGEDSLHITSIDADGVALAAIKQLAKENNELQSQNTELKQQTGDLQRQLDDLRALVQELISKK